MSATTATARQLGMFGEVARRGGERLHRLGPVPAEGGVPAVPAGEVGEAGLRRSCREAERLRREYGWDQAGRWVAHFCGPLDAAGVGR